MKKSFPIWAFFLLSFLVPVSIYAVVNWYEKHQAALPVLGDKSEGGDHVIGDFRLVNQDGQAVTADQWKGKMVVVNFFFTHCPVICPKMTANLKQVDAVAPQEVRIASFTVDPARDSIAQLKAYAERFELDTERWDLLTGPKSDLYRLARKSFLLSVAAGDGGENDFIHSDQLVLIDRKSRIRGYYSGIDAKEVQQLLRDINKLKNEK